MRLVKHEERNLRSYGRIDEIFKVSIFSFNTFTGGSLNVIV